MQRETQPKQRVRDPRLDFFRGIAMFVIFVAHVPWDWWALWIPARFGFSDATETFVFCSGMASAIAFGAVFERRGWLMGTARIAHRVWQVYWSHVALFVAVLALAMFLTSLGPSLGGGGKNYVLALNLGHVFDLSKGAIAGLLTLTYVPNYFDILPMYLGILAMIPFIMALARVSPWAAGAACVAMWLWANAKLVGLPGIDLPAEPWSNRDWFFNPFGWQLVFFTGFAFMRGWIPAPPVNRRLVILAAIVTLASVPFAYFRILDAVPELRAIHSDIWVLRDKTDFGPLRYVHFLATAYLAWVAVGPMGRRITDWGPLTWVVDVIRRVGQQSLAVFLTSMFLAQVAGFVLDQMGRSHATMALVNLAGFAIIIAVAYGVAWFKRQPWKGLPAQLPAPQSASKNISDERMAPVRERPAAQGIPAQ